MPTSIKFCGLNSPAAVHAAASNGAQFLGFIHHSSSPRHLSFEEMGALMRLAPEGVRRVAVMVNPDDDTLKRLMTEANPTHIQLHKVTDPTRIHAISSLTGLPLIVAINVKSLTDIETAQALEPHTAHILFDAAQAGSGSAFDWTMLKNLTLNKPWFLAGGLSSENVANAIAQTGAPMVDVSSGTESAPGQKSAEKIAQFHQAVLNGCHV